MTAEARYRFPNDAAAAVALLSSGERAVAIGGGTSFPAAGGPPKDALLVDLTRAGMDTIRGEGATLALGAALPAGELLRHDAGGRFAAGLLGKAAHAIGSPLIRNLVTVGGNLIAGHAWSAFPPALLCLDATLVFLGPSGERRLRYGDWLAGRPADLPPLLASIECPDPGAGARSAFLTLRKSAIDFPLVTVAALLPEGPAAAPRFALFGCTRRPEPLPEFASALLAQRAAPPGKRRDAALRQAAQASAAALALAGGYRIDPDHARAAAAALLARAAVELLDGIVPRKGEPA